MSITHGNRHIVGALCLLAATLPAGAQQVIEEVVVTAARREQGLQDVAAAVTAVTGSAIEERGIRDFAGYLAAIPGAALADTTGFGGEIKFRGVGTGTTAQMSPTTAVYLGEVPVIHTGRNLNSSYNFWLADLERIEVLRGPQGQLYGSNSLGGAIKNVPAQPDLRAFDARAGLTGSGTVDGGGNYDGDFMVNVPLLENRLGVRAVFYHSRDEGWYDNAFRGGPAMGALAAAAAPPPAPGALLPAVLFLFHPDPLGAATYAAPELARVSDTNHTDIDGGRVIVRWEAADRFSAELMVAIEDKETKGASFAEFVPAFAPNPFGGPPLANNGAATDFRDYEQFEAAVAGTSDDIHLYNLVLNYDFGGALLTSSTSYWDRTEQLDSDISISAMRITGFNDTVPIVSNRSDNPEVFVQELRLASGGDGRLDWMAGLFYQHTDQTHRVTGVDESGFDLLYWTTLAQSVFVPPPFAPPTPTTTTVADNLSTYEDRQFAAFGQIGFDLTASLHAAFSFRWLTLDQSFASTTAGFQFGLAQGAQSGDNKDDVFTPKFELSWRPAEDLLYYVSAAKGYRTGIINRDVPASDCGIELTDAGFDGGLPPTDADTLWNYELGAKLGLLDRRLQFNAALFYIDWSDIQMNFALSAFHPFGPGASRCLYDAVANMGDATSMGVELEASALLTPRMRLDVAFSYTDAEFEDTVMTPLRPLVEKGDTIPFTPDVTSMVALHYDFGMAALPAWGRFEWQYVGDKAPILLDLEPGDYLEPLPFEIGDYHQLNLRAGLEISDHITAELWVTNLANEFGVTSAADTGGFGFPVLTTIRPRTAGATLRWRY
jgi:outer membrane receptor protein involved in Fe transport